jgi:curli biogenesis system outer membrane secretion channel CsgG
MNRRTLLSLVVLSMLTAACGGGESEPATDSGAQSAAAGEPQEAVGRCAVDARDGAPYGRIAAEEVDASTGERMYRIEGEGGAQWNKKAGNVRVVDCPS